MNCFVPLREVNGGDSSGRGSEVAYGAAEIDTSGTPQRRSRGPTGLAIRTYQQIAQVLEAREGVSITPRRVAQLCHRAETRLIGALLADPLVRELLQTDAAPRPLGPNANGVNHNGENDTTYIEPCSNFKSHGVRD